MLAGFANGAAFNAPAKPLPTFAAPSLAGVPGSALETASVMVILGIDRF